jgi:polysaccharide export outer membrane protein
MNTGKFSPLFFVLFIFITSCRCPCDYATVGVEEFVQDSYVISMGKQAILEMQDKPVGVMPEDALCEFKDVIAEDDILNIVIYHPSRKDLMLSIQEVSQATGGFRVVDGRVRIPCIPPVYVKGLTLEEAKGVIRSTFDGEIKDIEIFVTYKDRLQKKVELIGQVVAESIPVDGKIRLYEVLAKAHLIPNANLFMSYVERGNCLLPIDLHQLMCEGDMCQNIVMRGGDKIFIANKDDAAVMVMGEVMAPRVIGVPYGSISLREALVTAGGIPFTGDRDCIQVIRGDLTCPKVYILSWKHITHLPNESLLLMPGDVVYVSEKPITTWNRFISQVFPSLEGLQTGFRLYNLYN